MITKIIESVDVVFPFEPYECQIAYMQKVIQALDMKCDAALESPTGTGKTLSLLCSTLAWVQKQKELFQPTLQDAMAMANETANNVVPRNVFVPRVYYCSRTHSQLAQVIRELNRTVYKIMPYAMLASREQTCIHHKVSKERDNHIKNAMCRTLVNKRTCHYYNKQDGMSITDANMMWKSESGEIMDIEDLVSKGKEISCCPFFRARQIHETAEIVLLPYNYLLSPELRHQHKVDLKNSIVIFDEAHNLENICEDCVSVEFSSVDLALCIGEMQKAITIIQERDEAIRVEMDNSNAAFGTGVIGSESKKKKDETFNAGVGAGVLAMMFNLETSIKKAYEDTEKKGKVNEKYKGKVFPGDCLHAILTEAQFSVDKSAEVCSILKQAADILNEAAEEQGSALAERGNSLNKFSSLLSVVYSISTKDAVESALEGTRVAKYDGSKVSALARDFKLYMTRDKTKDEATITLHYWCFSASVAMKYLKARGVRSIIVTSGTLSPLNNFMANIGLDFGCTLENGHAAKSNQLIAGIIKAGPKQYTGQREDLDGSYKNRTSKEYYVAIGETMLRLVKIIPQGVLVFFSSYPLMEETVKIFKERRNNTKSTIWDDLNLIKPIVVEPRFKTELSAVRREFTMSVRNPKINGGIFFAVCRGKVSEGIDFADADSRAVMIVGIPFPPMANPKVILKQMHLNERRATDQTVISGNEWYMCEAYRAVNQAIGRVLRHVNDFGIVALLDRRFATQDVSVFPSWMRSSLRKPDELEYFTNVVKRFFAERTDDIQKSNLALEDVGVNEKKRRTNKRPNISIEQEVMVYDEAEIQAVSRAIRASQNTEKLTQIRTIGELNAEKQNTIQKENGNEVTICKTFGAVSSHSIAPNAPARKKIKLKSNVPLGLSVANNRNESAQKASHREAKVIEANTETAASRTKEMIASTSASTAKTEVNDVQVVKEVGVPEKYKTALTLDRLEYKNRMQASSCNKELIVLLRQFKEAKISPMEIVEKLKVLLLPEQSFLFVATAQFLGVQSRNLILDYAKQTNLNI